MKKPRSKRPKSVASKSALRPSRLPQPEAKPGPPQSEAKHSVRKAAIAMLVTGVSLFLAALVLIPRMSVSMNTPAEGNFPSNEQFTFTNASVYSWHNVFILMGVCELSTETAHYDSGYRCDYEHLGGFTFPGWRREWLERDDGITISPGEKMPAKLSGLNVSFEISYEPWIIPITLRKTFAFETRTAADGKRYWFEVPVR